ncbi:serine palmitoyltransferase [Phakopsora pachyrhizi]|uniref:serine C-palmitoyltransferase n=1 Tax=Phakopsora pachyrhizi TaxID=170000 RepID=A0AAV0BM83_PHAPC|nr:serine palmitoyltransferase [Phakopsora pachyrhizi]CAH7687764.1 serine palmitoyltransferase [Phakopsora pachyrhizi]
MLFNSNDDYIYPTNGLTDHPLPSRVLSRLQPIISFDSSSSDHYNQSDSSDNHHHHQPRLAFDLDHQEFGFDNFNQNYRYTSQFRFNQSDHSNDSGSEPVSDSSIIKNQLNFIQVPISSVCTHSPEEPGYLVYLNTYLSYLILIILGHVRDFFGKRFKSEEFKHLVPSNGYAALNSDFDSFYTRRLKARMDDCFARPVTGVAGRTIKLISRISHDHCRSFKFTSSIHRALNISSYNYLGFAQSKGYVSDQVERLIESHSVSVGGSRTDVGNLECQIRCEHLISKFLGLESAILVSQGFATNSTTLPAIASKGTLIISDEFNHSSIRFGSRLSGALVRQYKHNDMDDLQKLLRQSISQGQPRTHRPWKKIIVIAEGIYSMEGTIVNLPGLYALKSIYKFYLYVDEAHSIGALGPRGRGVCDYFGLDPQVIDIQMGTLTKSFGASGGYIAGKKSIIDQLRLKNHSSVYAESMSPAVVQQIISSLEMISSTGTPLRLHNDDTGGLKGSSESLMGSVQMKFSEGQERLRRLAFNARYLSSGLRKLGFIVYGDRDSPIIPLLIFHPGKMLQFSRMMLDRYSIVVVVVAYPATPLVSSRVRFCVSASHTKEDIDRILIATDEIGEILGLKMSRRKVRRDGNGKAGRDDERWSIERVLECGSELID